MKIFSVYDSKAEAYLQPYFSRNNQTAIRDFTSATRDKNSGFSRNPADYTLMEIGEWNDNRGVITPLDQKNNLGTGLELRRLALQQTNEADQVEAQVVADLSTFKKTGSQGE